MSPAMKLPLFALALLLTATLYLSAQAPPTTEAAKDVMHGDKLNGEGKYDEAIAEYKKALQADPNLWQAHSSMGATLDLKGDYSGARAEFQKAIDLAPRDKQAQPLRGMAISYVFQKNTAQAAEYEQRAFQTQLAASEFVSAAGIADELARIYLESGDPDNAYKWYQTGHETALRNPKLTDAERDLWAFRWEHAQARIAARRGQSADAQQHVAAAKAIIDKGTNPDQAQFFPYLVGYVAFYGGDYKTAITELQKANQRDPLILSLLAQAYEKTGDQANALQYYRRVLEINAHSPTNAFARPLAKEKVAAAPSS